MRCDRFLAQTAGFSRKAARQALRAGRVTMNGQQLTDPAIPIDATMQLSLDGESLVWPAPRYLMLHKPAGYVCSHEDDGYPSILRLLPAAFGSTLHFAGRLDADTTGLLLLTDDGQWSHRLISPKHRVRKLYRVQIDQPLGETSLTQLRQGLLLKGEKHPTAPATVAVDSATEIRLGITEGRYHQVKRMLAALGYRVIALHREAIGALCLDVAEAGYRELTATEVTHSVFAEPV